jgi:hypothetical protein
MFTNKTINILIAITSIVVIPLQLVTTFVLGLLVSLTFGLLLIPISLVWTVLFLWPLLGLSYLYERVPILGHVLGIIGVPFAVIGNTYVALMPSMGEWDSRFAKMVICQTFPYTWRFNELQMGRNTIEQNDALTKILQEISKAKPLSKYLDSLRADVVSRPYYMKKNYNLDW